MSNRTVVEHALKCFSDPLIRHDYFELYSDDIVLHGYQGIDPGLENVKQFYAAFWSAFPDASVTAEEFIEQSDRVVVRDVITGTHRGNFMGAAASGKQIRLPGISILRFRNGKCFERWTASDSLLLLAQIDGLSMKKA